MKFTKSALLFLLASSPSTLLPTKASCTIFYITGCYYDCQSTGVASDAYAGIRNILHCVANGWGFADSLLIGDMQSNVWDCDQCGNCEKIIDGRFPPNYCDIDALPSCLRLEGPETNCCPLKFHTDELSCSLYDTSYCGASTQLKPPDSSIASCKRRQECGLANETCVSREFDGTRCTVTQGSPLQREQGVCSEPIDLPSQVPSEVPSTLPDEEPTKPPIEPINTPAPSPNQNSSTVAPKTGPTDAPTVGGGSKKNTLIISLSVAGSILLIFVVIVTMFGRRWHLNHIEQTPTPPAESKQTDEETPAEEIAPPTNQSTTFACSGVAQ